MALSGASGMPDLQVANLLKHALTNVCQLCLFVLDGSAGTETAAVWVWAAQDLQRLCLYWVFMFKSQLRMSKKIAQLTKVIYHLNNKNEDHDLDLQELAEQYETEIEQILKDTADKINFFKAQLDAANDQARIAELTKVGFEVKRHLRLLPLVLFARNHLRNVIVLYLMV